MDLPHVECRICCSEDVEQLVSCKGCNSTCCPQCREKWLLQRPPNAFFTTPCFADCGYFYSPAELLEIVGKGTFEKMQLRAAIDANTYYCPIPDCGYVGFWLGEEEEDEFPSGVCDGCKESRCILCGIIPYHEGQTCVEAKVSLTHSTESTLTAADIAKLGVKQCPSCREGVEKIRRTCNKMSCRCGYKFCFKCGAKDSNCACTGKDHMFWDNQRNCIMEEDEAESVAQNVYVDTGCKGENEQLGKMLGNFSNSSATQDVAATVAIASSSLGTASKGKLLGIKRPFQGV